MTDPTAKPPEDKPASRPKPPDAKADRLATALRANLARRKAQARGRAGAGEPDPSPDPRNDKD